MVKYYLFLDLKKSLVCAVAICIQFLECSGCFFFNFYSSYIILRTASFILLLQINSKVVFLSSLAMWSLCTRLTWSKAVWFLVNFWFWSCGTDIFLKHRIHSNSGWCKFVLQLHKEVLQVQSLCSCVRWKECTMN